MHSSSTRLCSLSLLLSSLILLPLLFSKEIYDMEKGQFQSVDRYKGICLENYIYWSIAYSKDEVSSDEEDLVEPVSRWIVGGKRKRLVDEQPDEQPVKDLIINDQQGKPIQLSMKQHWSEKSLIDEVFKVISKTQIVGAYNYFKEFDPSNFGISCQTIVSHDCNPIFRSQLFSQLL